MLFEEQQTQRLDWQSVRPALVSANPELARIIDEINPQGDFPLYKVQYAYGQKIIENGRCQIILPGSMHTVSLDDPQVPHAIAKHLSYASLPLAVSLNRANEVYVYDAESRNTAPLNMLQPGELFGVFEVLDALTNNNLEKPTWNVASGARTLFMLEKISDARKHARLAKEFNLASTAPQSLFSHYGTFAEIAQQCLSAYPWFNDVIFFSKPWFDALEDPKWQKLKEYLYQCGWKQSEYIRRRTFLSPYWKRLARKTLSQKYKHSAYLLDTVRYLTSACFGMVPAMRPTEGSELSAPVGLLELAYSDYYDLENKIPIMMQTSMHHANSNKPFYYSLNCPLLLESGPNEKNRPNLISDLKALKEMTDLITQTNQIIHQDESSKLKSFSFDYYHMHEPQPEGVNSIEALALADPNLSNTNRTDASNRTFPLFSPFYCGCIRVEEKRS